MIVEFKDKYSFLSNFWYVEVEFEGLKYKSVEHAFQASKSIHPEARLKIQSCKTAGDSKRSSKFLTLRKDWELIKESIMFDLLKQKFSKSPLKEMLLETEDEVLIEGNYWHDNFWGSCKCDKCMFQGKNVLGKLLMKVREELKNENKN